MIDTKRNFRHFHDYYSRTYPRYESYTSVEREYDIYNVIKSEIQNNNVIFEHNLYYDNLGNVNPKFKSNVLCCVGDCISSELSGAVIQEVIMILSSPEASVALSAPIINVISSSPEIKKNTINVVSESLSTETLTKPLTTAMKTVFKEPETVQAMKEPISAILPSEEVSGVVGKVASQSIDISAIYGGKEYKDDNKDGIPDDLQEDSEPPLTFIWGNLGA